MTQLQGKLNYELVKYPKIYILGSPENEGILNEFVVIESKVDGANFRCRYIPEEDRLIFGSRANEITNADPNHWLAIRAFKKAFEEHKEDFIPNVIYFAESMQKHTISYDEGMPDAIGYDIFSLETNTLWNYRAAKRAFQVIGIPFVNIHYEGMANDITQEIIDDYIKKSPYRKEGDEGIVIKCYTKLNMYGRPLFAKVVDPVFKEKNKEVFKGGGLPQIKIIESDMVNEYFVMPRFIKAINHFKDENEVIDMPLMPKLYKYISEDILSENILEIRKKYDSIDFKKFDNIIAKKCAVELKNFLIKGEIKC